MKRYRAILRVQINDLVLEYGQEMEIDDETAAEYAHALIAVEPRGEGEGNGRDS